MRTLVLAFSLALPALTKTSSQCYAPNGTAVSTSQDGVPYYLCPPGPDGHSTCCHQDYYCGPDKLCYGGGEQGYGVYRESCTDPSWGSTECSALCHGGAGSSYALDRSGSPSLTPCRDGTFCCGANNTNCCDRGGGTYAAAHMVQVGSQPYQYPMSSVSPLSTPTTVLATTTAASGQSHGVGTGALAAIVVLAIIALIGMLSAVILLYLRRRQLKAVAFWKDKCLQYEQHSNEQDFAMKPGFQNLQELDANPIAYEIDGRRVRTDD